MPVITKAGDYSLTDTIEYLKMILGLVVESQPVRHNVRWYLNDFDKFILYAGTIIRVNETTLPLIALKRRVTPPWKLTAIIDRKCRSEVRKPYCCQYQVLPYVDRTRLYVFLYVDCFSICALGFLLAAAYGLVFLRHMV